MDLKLPFEHGSIRNIAQNWMPEKLTEKTLDWTVLLLVRLLLFLCRQERKEFQTRDRLLSQFLITGNTLRLLDYATA